MQQHKLLIYNPIAGVDRKRNSQLGKSVRELLSSGGELTIYQTRYKGDAVEYIVHNDMSRFDMVICCGGDGTLNEVVNGLMKIGAKNVLGYIPQGTTNDYAKNLGISRSNSVKCINEGNIMNIDVGKLNDEYFNYVAAFGEIANISFSTPQKFKNLFGYCAYLLEGIKSLGNVVAHHIICSLEDCVIEDDILIGMVTNALSVGGFSGFGSKDTKLDDGQMEYLFIKMPKNVLELQHIIANLVNGKVDEKYMYVGKGRHLHVLSGLMKWTLDGEDGGCFDEVQIDIIDKALAMIVGK